MASTSVPASVRARVASRPRMMLMSCSGEGPPKRTAGRGGTGRLLTGSREVVGQVVLEQDDVARFLILLSPLLGRGPIVDEHDLGPALVGARHQRLAVGRAD